MEPKEKKEKNQQAEKKQSESASTVEARVQNLEATVGAVAKKLDNLVDLINSLSTKAPASNSQSSEVQAQGGLQMNNPIVQTLISRAIGGGGPTPLEKLTLRFLEGALKAQEENTDFTRAIKSWIIGGTIRKRIKGLEFHEGEE